MPPGVQMFSKKKKRGGDEEAKHNKTDSNLRLSIAYTNAKRETDISMSHTRDIRIWPILTTESAVIDVNELYPKTSITSPNLYLFILNIHC